MNENEDNQDRERHTEDPRYEHQSSRKAVERKLDLRDYMAFFLASLQTIFLPLIIVLIVLVVLVALIARFV